MAAAMLEMRPFLFRDPPDHTRLRGLVSKAFTPESGGIAAREDPGGGGRAPRRGHGGRLRSTCSRSSPIHLPVRIICDLLGVPLEDQDRFKVWSGALARGLDPDFLLSPEVIAARSESVLQFSQYFFELLAERRPNPGDDLLSRLVQAEDRGHRAERGRDAVHLHPVAGGRARDHGQPDRGRRPGPSAPPRPVRAVPLRSGAHPERRGGDAPLCVPGAAHRQGPDRGLRVRRRRIRRPATSPCCSWPRPTAIRSSSTIRSGSTSPGTRTTTSGSGSGSTTASGPRWPAWRPRWPSPHWCRQAPKLALAVDDVTYKTNVVLRGMESLPVVMHG